MPVAVLPAAMIVVRNLIPVRRRDAPALIGQPPRSRPTSLSSNPRLETTERTYSAVRGSPPSYRISARARPNVPRGKSHEGTTETITNTGTDQMRRLEVQVRTGARARHCV